MQAISAEVRRGFGGGHTIHLHLLTPIKRQVLVLSAFTSAFPAAFNLSSAVTAHAILDVGDPFLAVFGDDIGLLMLVATVTAIPFVIAAKVAGCAGGIVMLIKHEKAIVIKRRRFPRRCLVAG